MRTRKRVVAFALAAALFGAIACEREHFRGRAEPSADGRTYLVIEDDNGGACRPMFVDGREWPTPINRPHPISPGPHGIRCGAVGDDTEFDIPPGTTFYFDYWGP